MVPPPPPPRRSSAGRRTAVGVLAAAAFALAAALAAPAADEPDLSYARQDPAKIVTSTACGECHIAERAVWEGTPHATSFKTLHREESAEAIASRMGFRLLKRDSLCLRCHYTAKLEDGELRAVEGVSCESCHGAGRDWINVHNDYGKGYDRTSEPPEHRRQRIEASRRAGMRRPSDDLYAVAASCFGCHTVPNEKLVNVGGHTTGSADFELAAWTDKIRHNFLGSPTAGGSPVNRELSAADKRTLYVLGHCLDLEASLRAMAEASEDGTYSRAMSRRVRIALSDVQEIAARTSHPALEAMLATVRGVSVVPGNHDKIVAAAGQIAAATKRFMGDHDAERLAVLDPLVAGTEEAAEPEEVASGGAAAAPAGAATAAGTAGEEAREAAGQAAPAAAAGRAPAGGGGRPAVGELKRRIHPPSAHATLGPGACSGCHKDQNAWWAGDPHYRAANPFFDRNPDNVRIARLYGLRPDEITRGDQVCMDCHGTVISGKEHRDVFDGVSCESCHGASKDYLKPHEEGDAALGDKRPGYVAGLRLGMRELQDLEVRARTCTGCHYVTEPRLISAGHPSGLGFDFVAGMAKVRHWAQPPASAAALHAAFDPVLEERGPVPQVQLASLGEGAGAAAGAGGGAAAAGGGSAGRAERAKPTRTLPPRPRPPGAFATAERTAPLALPPFPEVGRSTPIEELLLILKQRLELLYRAIQEGKP
jgi:Cytochrome c554 and c-prime